MFYIILAEALLCRIWIWNMPSLWLCALLYVLNEIHLYLNSHSDPKPLFVCSNKSLYILSIVDLLVISKRKCSIAQNNTIGISEMRDWKLCTHLLLAFIWLHTSSFIVKLFLLDVFFFVSKLLLQQSQGLLRLIRRCKRNGRFTVKITNSEYTVTMGAER